jgi:hypothetical protein
MCLCPRCRSPVRVLPLRSRLTGLYPGCLEVDAARLMRSTASSAACADISDIRPAL